MSDHSANELTKEQKPLYEDMKSGIAKNFQGFVTPAQMARCLGPGILGFTS